MAGASESDQSEFEKVIAAAGTALSKLRRSPVPEAQWARVFLSQEPQPPQEVQRQLWALAGLQLALVEAFAVAWNLRGRAIVETTFHLHALLGQAGAQSYAAKADREQLENSGKKSARPPWELEAEYIALMRQLGKDAEWRAVILRWIDIFSERLTMHRYADPQHRARQARALIAQPLMKIVGEERPESETLWRALVEEFAGLALATHDLLGAPEQAVLGWNRIELPHGRQMGGFFGLGDEARPPTIETIAAAGNRIAGAWGQFIAKLPSPPLDWFAAALARGAEAGALLAENIAHAGKAGRPQADLRARQKASIDKIVPLAGQFEPAFQKQAMPGIVDRLKELLNWKRHS